MIKRGRKAQSGLNFSLPLHATWQAWKAFLLAWIFHLGNHIEHQRRLEMTCTNRFACQVYSLLFLGALPFVWHFSMQQRFSCVWNSWNWIVAFLLLFLSFSCFCVAQAKSDAKSKCRTLSNDSRALQRWPLEHFNFVHNKIYPRKLLWNDNGCNYYRERGKQTCFD